MVARPKIARWNELREEQADMIRQIEQNRKLLAEKKQWEDRYERLRRMLPHHPADRETDVYWLSVMDNLAARHAVKITKRQVRDEKKQGDVYELPIECREWEGTLDAIVHFLFDLQAEGAMLDVRQMLVRPKGKGLLKGRFSLYCAYTRAPAE